MLALMADDLSALDSQSTYRRLQCDGEEAKEEGLAWGSAAELESRKNSPF